MDELSFKNQAIVAAYNRGYRINKDGSLYHINRSSVATPYFDSNGYYVFSVHLSLSKLRKSVMVGLHRFQAYHKYGEKLFKDGVVVRHLNGNCLDNSWDNIAIGSSFDNTMDKPKEQRLKQAIKATEAIRRFADKEINKIREFHREFKSYRLTMEKFDISSKGSLYYILNNDYKSKK